MADHDVEEVRVALALNGGVSLAVWMGGCAVELDRARRTTADGDDATTYGALCRAFRRELVIDVMTGSSAGGINGGLLAAAITTGGSLEPGFIRDRWLQLGDFSELLQPLSNGRPESLMRGDYFAEELRKSFETVMGDRPAGATCPALDITTTDISGTPLELRDEWGGILHAREHRVRFRFREGKHFSAANLAGAARASASFPMAFEPAHVEADELRAIGALGKPSWMVDGGLLDNAPIRAALELIPTRPATRQVKRFLCYLNGDPRGGVHDDNGARPAAGGVVGAILNLPRTAPFADHLLALQSMARRSRLTFEAELALLGADLPGLVATATALLPAYRHRRRLQSLQDVLDSGDDARRAFDNLELADRELPWVPEAFDPMDATWRWGFEASRRVQHLALDLIRVALPAVAPRDRHRLLTVRTAIDARSGAMERGRDRFAAAKRESIEAIARGEDVPGALAVLEDAVAQTSAEQRAAVVETAVDLLGVVDLLGRPGGVDLESALFGPPGAADRVGHFLSRALAIEVLRRSFFDGEPIDDGQEIAFAQLTPEAPDLLFTAHPITDVRTPTADGKLCGTLFAHFSGFYRRSWRANDFLWGRLDAATRITQMLVSANRTQALASSDADQPWVRLARDLSGRGPEHDELIEEALADKGVAAEGPLADRLHDALRDDLLLDHGTLTRVIAARAAQFDVLREELEQLVDEATKDLTLGCSPHTLGLDGLDLETAPGVLEAVKRLRENPQDTFPKRLGRIGSSEWTSDLGVRTGARAGLVGLALARHAGGKAATPLTPLRSLLLPMAGAVAGRILPRLAVVAAFWAAAMYLGGRIGETDERLPADLATVRFAELLLAIIAWLVVLGTVLVPALRAWTRTGLPRAWAALASVVMALSGGLAAAALAILAGPLSWAQFLVAAGAPDPPTGVLVGPLLLGAGVFAGPRLLSGRFRRLAEPAGRGALSLAATFVSCAIVIWWSWDSIASGLDGMWWQAAAAAAALFAAPLSALVYFVIWPVLKGRLRRL